MEFRFKTLDEHGQIGLLILEAATQSEASDLVQARGLEVLSVQALDRAQLIPRRIHFDLHVFLQQLLALLKAGQSVTDAVAILGGNDRQHRHQAVYAGLLHGLRQGKQLSAAMEEIPSAFPPLLIALVRSSETTGSVQMALQRYLQYLVQVAGVRSKLVSAAIYPTILLAVGLLVVAFLLLHVIPRFSTVFEDLGQQQAGISGVIQQWGSWVNSNPMLAWSGFGVLMAALALLVLRVEARTWLFGRLLASRWVGDRIQIFQFARLYRTTSMLLSSGIHLLTALKMAESSLPLAMQGRLRLAIEGLGQGRAVSSVLAEQQLTTEVSFRLLLAGESSGNLAEMMAHIADFYEQEVAGSIDLASRLIEPALMVFIGVVIGGIVLALYVPIFDLANAVG